MFKTCDDRWGGGRGEQLLRFHPDPPMTKLCGYEKYDEKPIHEDEGKIEICYGNSYLIILIFVAYVTVYPF